MFDMQMMVWHDKNLENIQLSSCESAQASTKLIKDSKIVFNTLKEIHSPLL